MLNMSRLWQYLSVLLLLAGDDATSAVPDDEAGAGGALVD
jgi:hypothetical protein